MDVNSREWSQREFSQLSDGCDFKEDWACKKTGLACKDYLCHKVKSAANIMEVRSNFAQQTNGGAKPKLPKR
jgi:hypothetical protein